ncbi:MAG: DUF599 domain-containing protein [Candidatus Competibacteraceae bacterium]|nr:DUF599 domain-containing protein [Candidatus Competibacteraceae bacterium]MCB1812879.1 DUF599 domain-containing protein [Candidatus Competibacteraceae bacterium]
MNLIETLITLAVLIGYHAYVFHEIRTAPARTLQGTGLLARRDWVRSVMSERRDILAVQTLRNLTTTASFFASTAFLIAVGLLSFLLSLDKLPEALSAFNLVGTLSTKTLTIKLLLLVLNFLIAFFNLTLELRYLNYCALLINVPNGGETAVTRVVNLLERGARHHTLGVRGFFFGIPLALWLFGPLWMLSSALVLVILLYRLDHHLG